MNDGQLVLLSFIIFAVAALYASVGHAGASGYIAVLALFSVAPAALKPTALFLNILVSLVAAVQFCRAGHFSWRRFLPFAATSVPLAFVGGMLDLPAAVYRPCLGVILLFSAVRLALPRRTASGETTQPPVVAALVWGAILGFVSGLTGVGGGIFLSPLLLFMRWADARQASGAAAVFILVNSVAGLLGQLRGIHALPAFTTYLAIAAIIGGLLGSYLGSRRLPVTAIYRALSAVLAIAGLKLLLVRA